MNKSQLARKLAEQTALNQGDAAAAVDSVFAIIADEMDGGGEVTIAGFGKFGSRTSAARTGRNPATGESVEIAERTVPTFKAARGLRDSVNG